MRSNRDNQKNAQILHELKMHLGSLAYERPESLLPHCKCIKYVQMLVEKGIISANQVCLCCKSFHRKPGKDEGCPFREED